jgi:hypothetical protein
MQRLKSVLIFIVLTCCPAALLAEVRGSYTNTTGSHGFDSNTVGATLNLSSGFYLGASYNSYHSDNSSGTINSYSGRLGRYTPNGSWELYGSATPEVSNYQETSAGGEFRVAVLGRDSEQEDLPLPAVNGLPATPPPPKWHANPRLDFMAGYTRDMFKDQGQNIDENDVMGGLGFNLFKTYLSGSFTKSLYDQEFNGTFNPNARRFNVGYIPTLIPGYPDYDYAANIDQTLLPGWWILASYTHLKYKAGPDDLADMYSAGTGVSLFHYILLTVMYTRYVPTGSSTISDKQNFLSLGAGLHF